MMISGLIGAGGMDDDLGPHSIQENSDFLCLL
jgi:hypothetical protein